jgi:hypothetical protein
MAKQPQYENDADDYEPRKQPDPSTKNYKLIAGVVVFFVAAIAMIALILAVVFKGAFGR